MRVIHLVLLIAFAVAPVSAANGQPADTSALERTLAPGATVWITDATGSRSYGFWKWPAAW